MTSKDTMSKPRQFFGVLMLIAAPVVIFAGYLSVPSASACNTINSIQAQLGSPPTCSTTPAPAYFAVAGILVAAGLLFLAPWWLRWLAGK